MGENCCIEINEKGKAKLVKIASVWMINDEEGSMFGLFLDFYLVA